MTIHQANEQLVFQLMELYDERESRNITSLVMEHLTGWKKIDRVLNKTVPLLDAQLDSLEYYTKRLLASAPVQYVLAESWFYGMKFYVDENVLIPRPETEELVEWAAGICKAEPQSFKTILDIGTGSGCIAITMKKLLPALDVHACDVSKSALEIAAKNAASHDKTVSFHQADILQVACWTQLPEVDLIISNPPYIPQSDKSAMRPNVLAHEPHLALFVGDEDPLVFYRIILEFAKKKLHARGAIFLELHAEKGRAVESLLVNAGFQATLKKDMQGLDRMVMGRRVS